MTFTTGDFHDTKVLDEISDFVFAAGDNTKILRRLMALERGMLNTEIISVSI